MKPKEGTILTVARGMAEKASELATEGMELEEMMEAIVAEGDAVLARTPEMLPVLSRRGGFRRTGPDAGHEGCSRRIQGKRD